MLAQSLDYKLEKKIVFIAHYHSEIEILEVCGLIPHRRARGLIKPLKIKESCG